ncbi:hypothetical protein [Halomonas litopenaei]|uniref:hypothetical protein n=1 Tax=Halomonas litopenaei TaxID=2109328 RepID=UPI001A8FCA87|nr:hypothetical protein [Halomonas litopenaei]MBN8414357.1 hypothetical protein [Halomonas litopenaei]
MSNSQLFLSDEVKEKYITAHSHNLLAKELGISLLSLDKYAKEHFWDEEHKLYWQDLATAKLKEGAEGGNHLAIKELLKLVGLARPIGRPPKAEVERKLAKEVQIEKEYQQDMKRLATIN